jgi:hypothetical protein
LISILFLKLKVLLLSSFYSTSNLSSPAEEKKKKIDITLVGLEECVSALHNYLTSPSGVLLCGVAGVGKSTLVKHIWSDPKVIESLRAKRVSKERKRERVII